MGARHRPAPGDQVAALESDVEAEPEVGESGPDLASCPQVTGSAQWLTGVGLWSRRSTSSSSSATSSSLGPRPHEASVRTAPPTPPHDGEGQPLTSPDGTGGRSKSASVVRQHAVDLA